MMNELVKHARNILNMRKKSYTMTFTTDKAHVRAVLRDLAKFCRAHETTFHSDPRAHAILEGRREVWLRLSQHLNLTEEKLWELYGKRE